MTDRYVLVSHHLCPYVQRVAISLAEKETPFRRVTIDLANRPDWFRTMSPLGKVPVLCVDGAPLFESAAILDYLEETLAHPLHPSDPFARARHRAWIEYGSAILNDIWSFYTAPDATALEAKTQALAAKFAWIERELGEGPWFAGPAFSLVDAAFGPVFRYFDAFDRIAAFGMLDGLEKVAHWRQALAERLSVQGAITSDYPEALRAFLLARNSHLSGLMRAAQPVA